MLCCVFSSSRRNVSAANVLAASSYIVWMPALQHPRGWLDMQYLDRKCQTCHHKLFTRKLFLIWHTPIPFFWTGSVRSIIGVDKSTIGTIMVSSSFLWRVPLPWYNERREWKLSNALDGTSTWSHHFLYFLYRHSRRISSFRGWWCCCCCGPWANNAASKVVKSRLRARLPGWCNHWRVMECA